MIEWMAQADPLRKSNTVKKMNNRSLLFSINQITHCFKKWTTRKNVMLQIDPLKSSCSQKQHNPEITLRLKALGKSSSLEKVAVPKVTLASAIVYNCSSKIFTILYE